MAKLTLADLANLQNEQTAVSAYNANNALLETAVENTLSRDGTAPNSMSADLDMNSRKILNLPSPDSDTEPLRLQDLEDFIGGELVIEFDRAVSFFETQADAETTVMRFDNKAIILIGINNSSEGLNAMFVRTTSEPSHTGGKFRTADRFLPDETESASNGGWWVYKTPVTGVDARVFGAKFDWVRSDGLTSGTDNTTYIQNAIDFAAISIGNGPDLGGGYGSIVRLPKGAGRISALITVKDGVRLIGHSPMGTIIATSSTFSTSTHVIILGSDTNAASFGTSIEDVQIWNELLNSSAGTSCIYSDNIQHTASIKRVKIFSGNRHGIFLEIGQGGAAYLHIEDVEVFGHSEVPSASVNSCIKLNYAGLVTSAERVIAQFPPTSQAADNKGVEILGGKVVLNTFHCEGDIAHGIFVNIPNIDSGFVEICNANGGIGVDNVVRIATATDKGSVKLHMISSTGATNCVSDEASGYASGTDTIMEYDQWRKWDYTTGANVWSTYGLGALQTDANGAVTSTTLPVSKGGSGAATLTGLLQGTGTTAVTAITNSSTVGQVLRVTGANTYGWGALDIADGDAVTGLGTGVTTALGINVGTDGAFVTKAGALGSPSSVGTLPAFTLGGTISGGGNQLNNIQIGVVTPLAATFTTVNATTSITATSTSATSLAAGPNGSANPAFLVDSSTGSSATGIKIKSAAATGGVAISAITSGTNENLTINAAGSGTITLNNTATGAITLGRGTLISGNLQVGTGANSIGLGTATPNYTGYSSALTIETTGGSGVGIEFAVSGVLKSAFSYDGTNMVFLGQTGTGVIFRANASGSAGLTLTSGQKVVIGQAALTLKSFAVASLPAGATGDVVWASDGKAITGSTGATSISVEAGAGTGCLVTYNGTAWKIAGTNVTVTA